MNVQDLIARAARRHGVEATLVRSIIQAESAFDQQAISPVGAIGLMQLMPATAAELGFDPAVPEQNVEAGTQYIAFLLARYGRRKDLALAAYNAGPGAVDQYGGIPPFAETREYVRRVLELYNQYRRSVARPQAHLVQPA